MATGNRNNVNLQPRDSSGRFTKEGLILRPIKVKKVKGTLGTYKIVERKFSDETRENLYGFLLLIIFIFVTWSFSKFYYLYIA